MNVMKRIKEIKGSELTQQGYKCLHVWDETYSDFFATKDIKKVISRFKEYNVDIATVDLNRTYSVID